MEILDVGSQHRIQFLKEALANRLQLQPTKDWTITERVFDSLHLLFIATYSALVRLESVPDTCQRPNLAVHSNKPNTYIHT